MAEATAVAKNTAGWYDINSADIEGTRGFYTGLFGWTVEVVPDPGAGGYGFFLLDGKQVAGCGPVQSAQQPTVWSTYVIVDDARAIVSAAKAAGGSVVVEPMDVMGQGTLAFIGDPSGAPLGLWQPAQMGGAAVQGIPGSGAWVELHSTDMAAAKPFYSAVFGWSPHDADMGGMTYTEFKIGDTSIAGGTPPMPGQESVPSHWLVYFATSDVDASTGKAAGLGATVLAPAMDFPGGRFSIIQDPQGAVFGLLKLAG